MTRRARTCSTGFTLVEAVAALAIIGVVVGIAANILFTSADAYTQSNTRADLVVQADAAMQRMVRELREIPLREGQPQIEVIAEDALMWGPDDYTLSESSGTITLIKGPEERVIATDVTSFLLVGFDESNSQIPPNSVDEEAARTRRIEITLTVERDGVSHTLRTRAHLRTTMPAIAQ